MNCKIVAVFLLVVSLAYAQTNSTTPQTQGESSAPGSEASTPDPLSLSQSEASAPPANALPPFSASSADAISGGNSDLSRRIRQTEELLNRMSWQLNRETSWANSVHDIIQNYQYKYTKFLQSIKKHQQAASKMKGLLATLKQARLHEVLQADLNKATDELTELASSESSSEASGYSSLKDRIALMKQDVEKMKNERVNKVVKKVQDAIKQISQETVPPSSADTLSSLLGTPAPAAPSKAPAKAPPKK